MFASVELSSGSRCGSQKALDDIECERLLETHCAEDGCSCRTLQESSVALHGFGGGAVDAVHDTSANRNPAAGAVIEWPRGSAYGSGAILGSQGEFASERTPRGGATLLRLQ